MSERGVYAIDRALWDDPDFKNERYTEKQAFAWLIGAAAWQEVRLRIGTVGTVTLQRGEFCYSVRFLAEKWGWSKSRVNRFILRLQNRDILRDASRDSMQVYSIKNYNKFQIIALPSGTDHGTPDGTAAGQQRDKEEDIKDIRIAKDARASVEELCRAMNLRFEADPRRINWPNQLAKLLEQGVELQDLVTAAKATAGRSGEIKSLMYLRPAAEDAKRIRLATKAAEEFHETDAYGWEKRFTDHLTGKCEWSRYWGGTSPGDDPRHPRVILEKVRDKLKREAA